ncbi:MAG: phosphocholine cytidylyltransferase family protein [Parachlamydiaceae bacterium]
MKVIILAAGKGSRLGGKEQPKPLTELATGKSILARQLASIGRYTSLDNVIVVVGYHKEMIMEQFPDLLYVYNPSFAFENTSKSLLRALKKCQEDVLWLNGDVVFHDSVLRKVLDTPRTSMVVNEGAVGEEEVKYRKDSQGRILAVSKQVNAPHGEALGINYCTASDLKLLCEGLEQCDGKDYFERGIELCIDQGMVVWSVSIDQGLCTEVDFPADLVRANTMLLSW